MRRRPEVSHSASEGIERACARGADTVFRLFPDWHRRVMSMVIMLEQANRLSARAPGKYRVIQPILYAGNVCGRDPVLSKVAEMTTGLSIDLGFPLAYHFGRMVDDSADGDLPLPEKFNNFTAFAASLKDQIKQCTKPPNNLAYSAHILLYEAMESLQKRAREDDSVSDDFIAFIEGMEHERSVRDQNRVLTQEQLDEVYERTFTPADNITLIALTSRYRAPIPDFAKLRGRTYALFDMRDELPRGEINIPAHVAAAACAELGQTLDTTCADPDLLNNSTAFQRWAMDEIAACSRILETMKHVPLDRPARRFFVDPLLQEIDTYLQFARNTAGRVITPRSAWEP